MGRYGFSKSGNPLTTFVNKGQTKEERREKYWLARSMGYNPSWSRSMRDWRLTKIERKLKGDKKI